MAPDGGDLERVTAGPARDIYPTWSPDGQRLAFASDRSGSWDVHVVDLASGEVTRLTHSPARDESGLVARRPHHRVLLRP